MMNERRQRLNVRTILVSFQAAVRSTGESQLAFHAERAQNLLAHARGTATSARVRADVDEAQRYIDSLRQEGTDAERQG